MIRFNKNLIRFYISIFSAISVDTEAPIVYNCPQVVEVEVEQQENGSFVRWDGPNVEDNSGSYDVILETDLQRGSFFPIGLTHVAVSFVDPAGQKSECTTDVIVSRGTSTKVLPVYTLKNQRNHF